MVAVMLGVDALWKELNAPTVSPARKVIDGRWNFGSCRADYEVGHIPGAQYFDIEEIADKQSALPHMASAQLPDAVAQMGISPADNVVITDATGLFSAPRVWWDLASNGFSPAKLQILRGGMRAWSHPLEQGAPPAVASAAPASRDARQFGGWVDRTHVAEAIGTAVIIDARPADRYAGAVDEPRPGLRKGHIPTAISVPFPTLLEADGSALLSPAALQTIFAQAGLTPDHQAGKEIITYCGSGITACIVSLALYTLGIQSVVYDGSWLEWGVEWGLERGQDTATPMPIEV